MDLAWRSDLVERNSRRDRVRDDMGRWYHLHQNLGVNRLPGNSFGLPYQKTIVYAMVDSGAYISETSSIW